MLKKDACHSHVRFLRDSDVIFKILYLDRDQRILTTEIIIQDVAEKGAFFFNLSAPRGQSPGAFLFIFIIIFDTFTHSLHIHTILGPWLERRWTNWLLRSRSTRQRTSAPLLSTMPAVPLRLLLWRALSRCVPGPQVPRNIYVLARELNPGPLGREARDLTTQPRTGQNNVCISLVRYIC